MSKILLKRGNKNDLIRVNPILLQGEPVFVIDENKLKIGDGITTFDKLPYLYADVIKVDEIKKVTSAMGISKNTVQKMIEAAVAGISGGGTAPVYNAPTFSSFSIQGQSTTLEVGDEIAANPTFTWATTNSSNVAANSINIYDQTILDTLIVGPVANSGSTATTYGPIAKTSATSNVFRIEGTDTQSTVFSKTYQVNWKWRIFYGTDTNPGPLTEVDIEPLVGTNLADSFVGTYSFAGGGYKYLAFPTTFGIPSYFKDVNTNFTVPMQAPYVVTLTNNYSISQDYNVFRTTNILGGSITIGVS